MRHMMPGSRMPKKPTKAQLRQAVENSNAQQASAMTQLARTLDGLSKDMAAFEQMMLGTKVSVAEAGNTVVVGFVGRLKQDDGSLKLFDGGTSDSHIIESLGSGSMIPGFEEAIVGMEVGSKKQVEITFPEDYGRANLAGKLASFDIILLSSLRSEPLLGEASRLRAAYLAEETKSSEGAQ